jgi:hypothetical protein
MASPRKLKSTSLKLGAERIHLAEHSEIYDAFSILFNQYILIFVSSFLRCRFEFVSLALVFGSDICKILVREWSYKSVEVALRS